MSGVLFECLISMLGNNFSVHLPCPSLNPFPSTFFSLAAQSCLTLWDPMDCSLPGSSIHGGSPGKDTGVGCHAFLQGIFPAQGSNPGLHHCRRILHHLSQKGSPRILEWVASPFSRGTSWPRNWTGVSCIAGGFVTSWATWEVPLDSYCLLNRLPQASKIVNFLCINLFTYKMRIIVVLVLASLYRNWIWYTKWI